MTTHEKVIAFTEANEVLKTHFIRTFNTLKAANVFSDEWFDYGREDSVDNWSNDKLSSYDYSGWRINEKGQIFLFGRSYLGGGEYETKSITLTYEDIDNLEDFIKRRKKAALYKVHTMNLAKRQQKIEDELREEEDQRELYEMLKAKYECGLVENVLGGEHLVT